MSEMLRCENCGDIFDETELRVRHSHEYGDIESCPRCRSEEIQEVHRCSYCGEWISKNELEEGLCPKCAGETIRLFKDLLNNTFSEDQIFFLSRVDCF